MNFAILLIYLGILAATVYGWIHNIYLLAISASFGVLELIRALGVIAFPLGAVMGYVG
jgi:hypothetical protein